jgi:hypothetical protein
MLAYFIRHERDFARCTRPFLAGRSLALRDGGGDLGFFPCGCGGVFRNGRMPCSIRRAISSSDDCLLEGFNAMTDAPAPATWPTYEVGPHESVFALGVASVNYSRLEFALSGVFANVVGLTSDFTFSLFPSIGNNVRLRLIRKYLAERDWPSDPKDRIAHFINAFEILAENRNLRQVADDMMTFFNYGLSLTAFISLNLLGLEKTAVALGLDTWPDKPPLPRRLDYKSQP